MMSALAGLDLLIFFQFIGVALALRLLALARRWSIPILKIEPTEPT